MRAPHLPSTTAPREIGAEARRRSRPWSRSTTSVTAPLVSSTSIVNITIVPGTACSKPIGGTRRLPAGVTESVSARGIAASAANDAGDPRSGRSS